MVIVMADDADGTDGIFTAGVNRNRPRSRASCSAKSHFYAQRAKKSLCTPQWAGECPGIVRPTWAAPRNAMIRQVCTHTQKGGSASCSRAAVRHDLPHASADRVGIDTSLVRTPSGCLISAADGSRSLQEI